MKISLNWLKEFIEITESAETLADRFTGIGLAVDALERTAKDALYELDVATNRPDCLSHLGIAREAGVTFGKMVRRPHFDLREGGQAANQVFSISIADSDLCRRYCGRYIEAVRIGPSPDWLRMRLEGLGIRSINNVADVTNYVMLELGQPLHAFDANKLADHRIIVRRAEPGEKITTLDGVDRELNPSILVIADGRRPVAIAGIMGGAKTEISATTTNVLLESANFDALSIRKTSRALALGTEASYRFERGADVDMCRFACDRAAAMIQEVAGGEIYKSVIDVYPKEIKPVTATLRRHRIETFLGSRVDDDVVERIFRTLGFQVNQTSEGWSVEVPSHRVDIGREEDLLEEIARHHGFDKFPATLPAWSGHGSALPSEAAERQLRSCLAALGYSESIPMAFSDEAAERRFRPDVEPVRLLNPMAEDQAILRTSLLPSMLRTLQWNVNRGTRDLQLYECGKIYRKGSEHQALIIAVIGTLRSKNVHELERSFGFYDVKGDVEAIFERFNVEATPYMDAPAYYHPGRSMGHRELAVFGELHPDYAEMFKLRQRVYIAELNVERVLQSKVGRLVHPIPKFPSVRRDLSLLIDKGTPYEVVHAAIPNLKELIHVEPFDRMEQGPFSDSKYSLSISLIYQSHERTLTDAEVDEFDAAILSALQSKGIVQRK
jgi:phenylalanyl-tRNA synthetase beta chain